ncbi:MAG: hypothetical protein IPL65_05355 [Lewinellaceae bacterium]|nr:hypothetical protein [Lewinellaceae bacterium]
MKQKKKKSGRRTAKEMYAHIRLWEDSGQSQKAFIAANGLSKSVFGYWLRRYRQEGQSGFVEVVSAPVKADQGGVFARIQTTQDSELVLYESVSAAFLRELLW